MRHALGIDDRAVDREDMASEQARAQAALWRRVAARLCLAPGRLRELPATMLVAQVRAETCKKRPPEMLIASVQQFCKSLTLANYLISMAPSPA